MGDTDLRHRIVTWNCNSRAAVWDCLLDLHPDVALLQEVGPIPERVNQAYDIRLATPVTENGAPQRFKTALLVRGTIADPLVLAGTCDWVNSGLQYFAGNVVAYSVTLADGIRFNAVSVYSPAWPVSPSQSCEADVSSVRLPHERGVWVADLLRAALKHQLIDSHEQWVIGGDFNSSPTFDDGPDGDRGNREYLREMDAMGLVECLSHSQGKLTPTFRNPKGGRVVHQIDHLFVTSEMAAHLVRCETGSPDQVFGFLSDHLPIIADFER